MWNITGEILHLICTSVSLPRKSQMDLETALQDSAKALDLFLNNRFSDALDLLRPWYVPVNFIIACLEALHALR